MNLGQHADSMSWGWSRHPTCQGRISLRAALVAQVEQGPRGGGQRACGDPTVRGPSGSSLKSIEILWTYLDSDHCFPVITFFRAGNFLRNHLRRFPWNDQLVRFCCSHTRVGLLCLLAWVAGTWSPAPLIMETVHFLLPPWLTPSED